jgi:hypothetical protein
VKKITKAVLLSAFVFPGLGHLYLKKRLSGSILMGASFAAIYYLMSKVVENALQIAEKIQSGEVQPDAVTISELLSQQSNGSESQLQNIATAVFVICWLIGIIDSYRLGRVRDKNELKG